MMNRPTWLHHAPMPTDGPVLVPNDTGTRRRRIRCLYSDAIAAARRHVYLMTRYFVPDLLMQQRLMNAARRGVDARVLVPSRSDVPLTRWAARAIYAALIEYGVGVYEYLPRMLHAKTVLIDGQWVALGTTPVRTGHGRALGDAAMVASLAGIC